MSAEIRHRQHRLEPARRRLALRQVPPRDRQSQGQQARRGLDRRHRPAQVPAPPGHRRAAPAPGRSQGDLPRPLRQRLGPAQPGRDLRDHRPAHHGAARRQPGRPGRGDHRRRGREDRRARAAGNVGALAGESSGGPQRIISSPKKSARFCRAGSRSCPHSGSSSGRTSAGRFHRMQSETN